MKDFKKYYSIKASPEEVYLAIVSPLSLQLWTGEPAQMSTEINSEFSLWDGSIEGKNLAFEHGKKIVQQWYFGEQVEESIVTLLFHADKQKTSVELNHINIPDEDFDDIVKGWNEIYFESLKDFFEE